MNTDTMQPKRVIYKAALYTPSEGEASWSVRLFAKRKRAEKYARKQNRDYEGRPVGYQVEAVNVY